MKINAASVRKLREQRAWSQEHLAECAGVSLRTIQRVEAEGSASYDTLQGLAAVFGVSPTELGAEPIARASVALWHTLGVALSVVGTLVGLILAWHSLLAQGAKGAVADSAYGVMGLLSGLAGAWIGVIVGGWFKARGQRRWARAGSALVAAAAVAVCLGISQRVAEAETLLVRIDGQHDQDRVHSELVTEAGHAAVMELGHELRLEVIPTLEATGQILLQVRLFAFRAGKAELISAPALRVDNKRTASLEVSTDGRRSQSAAPYRFELTPFKNESGSRN